MTEITIATNDGIPENPSELYTLYQSWCEYAKSVETLAEWQIDLIKDLRNKVNSLEENVQASRAAMRTHRQ